MILSKIRAVYVKELRSLLRDRHILLYSVAVPAFLYPVLILGTLQVVAYIQSAGERNVARVLVDESAAGIEAGLSFREYLEESELKMEPVESGGGAGAARARELLKGADELDAVVVLRRHEEAEEPIGPETVTVPLAAEIFYDDARGASQKAAAKLKEALSSYRERRLNAAAERIGESPALLDAVSVNESSLSTEQELSNYILSLLLPLFMILMIALGAFFTALDATVGVKERRSLETTLTAPVGRSVLVLGKYLAVVTMSFLSFALNLAGMLFSFSHLQAQLPTTGFELGLGAAGIIALAALFLAAFFSAVMMLIAFLARTFKEGQSYVSPIYVCSILPVIVAMNPEVRLTTELALVPLIGSVLLFREALGGELELVPVLLTFAVSILCSVVALVAAARVLAREDIATGGEIPWRQLLAVMLGRRSTTGGEVSK